jgi:hypothetical protein
MADSHLADVAQLVEHSLGKGEVTSSILVIGSRDWFGRFWLVRLWKGAASAVPFELK